MHILCSPVAHNHLHASHCSHCLPLSAQYLPAPANSLCPPPVPLGFPALAVSYRSSLPFSCAPWRPNTASLHQSEERSCGPPLSPPERKLFSPPGDGGAPRRAQSAGIRGPPAPYLQPATTVSAADYISLPSPAHGTAAASDATVGAPVTREGSTSPAPATAATTVQQPPIFDKIKQRIVRGEYANPTPAFTLRLSQDASIEEGAFPARMWLRYDQRFRASAVTDSTIGLDPKHNELWLECFT